LSYTINTKIKLDPLLAKENSKNNQFPKSEEKNKLENAGITNITIDKQLNNSTKLNRKRDHERGRERKSRPHIYYEVQLS